MSLILHITDPHLLDTRGDLLNAVPPAETLRMVLDEARERFPNPGRVIWSGDLAHSETLEGYKLFKELIGDWSERSLFLPGNHENRESMRLVLPNIEASGNERMSQVAKFGGWRLLLLDSRLDDEVAGSLFPADIEVIANSIKQDPDMPTLIFLHHQPININASWLDDSKLQNSDDLAEALNGAGNVKGMFFGHVHGEVNGEFAGIPAYATPSTAFQFDHSSTDIAFDLQPPGFRYITLQSSSIETGVVRLPELAYVPIWDE